MELVADFGPEHVFQINPPPETSNRGCLAHQPATAQRAINHELSRRGLPGTLSVSGAVTGRAAVRAVPCPAPSLRRLSVPPLMLAPGGDGRREEGQVRGRLYTACSGHCTSQDRTRGAGEEEGRGGRSRSDVIGGSQVVPPQVCERSAELIGVPTRSPRRWLLGNTLISGTTQKTKKVGRSPQGQPVAGRTSPQ